jgi:hypothetical protein
MPLNLAVKKPVETLLFLKKFLAKNSNFGTESAFFWQIPNVSDQFFGSIQKPNFQWLRRKIDSVIILFPADFPGCALCISK